MKKQITSVPMHWDWAQFDLENGDPHALADLLRSGKPVPSDVAEYLADYLTGKGKPWRKGASNRKMTPTQQRRLEVESGFKHLAWWHRRKFIEQYASAAKKEPGEIRQASALEKKTWEIEAAKRHGVSVDTIRAAEKNRRARWRKK